MSDALEESILGAILDAEGPILKTGAGLLLEMSGMRPEDFQSVRVRETWKFITSIASRRGRPVDALSVYSAGRQTKRFAEPDLEWLRGLQNGNTLDRERFANLAEDMREGARLRQLEKVLEKQLAAVKASGANLAHIASDLDTALKDIIAATVPDGTGQDDVIQISNDWDEQENGKAAPTLFPTGLPMLDEIIGGWVPNLNIVMALPSVGKSGTLVSCVDGQTAAGLRVGVFGLEEGTKWMSRRIIAREMSLPVRSVGFVRRTPEQQTQFGEVASRVAKQMRSVVTFKRPRGALVDVREILRRGAAWVRNENVGCIWIDHGGEIDPGPGQGDQMTYRVAANYARIRDFAEDYSVPVVALCHTRRPEDGNEDRPPLMTEAADSSRIEKMARVMIGGWRRRFTEPDYMRLTVLKASEGEVDITVRAKRWKSAAMLQRDNWERVDLQAERNLEQKEKREKKEAEAIAKREQSKQTAAALKAAKNKQRALLEES